MQGDSAYWDEPVELLAQTIDALHEQTFALLTAWGSTPRRPDPVPRPGAREPVATGTLSDFNALVMEG